MPNDQSLASRDRQIVWHPFTQITLSADTIVIKCGRGSYVYDENNKEYIDLIASWWVNLHGHGHPAIAQSIYEQALQLDHVIFAGFTHEPAVTLCEELQPILSHKRAFNASRHSHQTLYHRQQKSSEQPELTRFFFSDDGSTAVEVALKIAYQYWRNQGCHDKSLFLSFEGGYHGDTFGAMAVGKRSGFHNTFTKLFFEVITLPYPATWDPESEDLITLKESQALTELDLQLANSGTKIAAMIIEPLIQGASGMRVVRNVFIEEVVRRVRDKGILVIFDEVMTGFGRTGSLFAMSQLEVGPDIICLSKGLTGGFLPLALTVASGEVYEAFVSSNLEHTFLHGHSYTANPIACRAALTSLQLLQSQETQQSIVNINQIHRLGIDFLAKQLPQLDQCRVLGTISRFRVNGIDMRKLKQDFLSAGLLLRPLDNVIYLMPPYSTTKSDLENAYTKICDILEAGYLQT